MYLAHKTDNLEATAWQLYDAGYRPNLKYGIGMSSWVSLTVNKTCFAFRSRQLIDWAIDGTVEVSDAAVFHRMCDAKTEFHYQLFKSSSPSTGASTMSRAWRSWTSAVPLPTLVG